MLNLIKMKKDSIKIKDEKNINLLKSINEFKPNKNVNLEQKFRSSNLDLESNYRKTSYQFEKNKQKQEFNTDNIIVEDLGEKNFYNYHRKQSSQEEISVKSNEDFEDEEYEDEEEEEEFEEEEEELDDSEIYGNLNKQNQDNILNRKSNNDFYLKENDYLKKNRLKEIIGYLKVQKQPFDESDLNSIFKRLDKDGNNSITSEELKNFLLSLKTPINEFYIDKIVNDFDANEDGKITKHEFFNKMNTQVEKINENDFVELWEIFKLFDANHDDIICHEDLSNVFTALGESINEQNLEQMIKFLGDDKNGGIDFSKFFELVKDEGKR